MYMIQITRNSKTSKMFVIIFLTSLVFTTSFAEEKRILVSDPGYYQDSLDRLESKLVGMETEITSLKNTVVAQNVTINSLKNQIAAKDQSVAFMAIMDKDLINPSANHIIIFNHVMTNVGNAYNPHTGTFIAPVSGTYFFALALGSPTAAGGHLGIWLQKDGVNIAYLFFDLHSQYWVKRTDTTAVHMNKGDSVYTIVLSVSGNHTIAGSMHSNLSGFLIQAD